ncbi:hypothetical protein [Streptomyces sp. CA-253872]|uniref:hypothetical protein n=1 Tax=Streptomyces sp. CA-253872 TaxID=3240067 RepID=UPI003D92DA0E
MIRAEGEYRPIADRNDSQERAPVLLGFRSTNHKSLRDTTELVLTKSGFAAVRPKDGDWGGGHQPGGGALRGERFREDDGAGRDGVRGQGDQ